MEPADSGEWYISRSRYGSFVHARLGIGEESSGKLVSVVRKKAAEIAAAEKSDLVLIDGPPGIGCPVIASLSGTDLALIVTEPTLSGLHDMRRVIQTAAHFKIPTACCLNKSDINAANAEKIEIWCRDQNIPMVGRIPFDERIPRALARGAAPIELDDSAAAREIRRVWGRLERLLRNGDERSDP